MYLNKSTIRSCMEYCCHVSADAPSHCLKMLDKLQQMCRTVGPSLSAYLEPLDYCRSVASLLSLFYRNLSGKCSSELAELVPLLHSSGRSTCYSDGLHDFCVIIPRYYKNVNVNSFFPHIATVWNSLPIECFSLTYDLNSFNLGLTTPFISRFFPNSFPVCFKGYLH